MVWYVWVCVVGEGGVCIVCVALVSCRVLCFVFCVLCCGASCCVVVCECWCWCWCAMCVLSLCVVLRVCVVCGVWRGLTRGTPPRVLIQNASVCTIRMSVCTSKTPAC